MNYSVLMSIYKNERVEYFVQAVDSLLNQTVLPQQIVLVRDGVVYEELQRAIDKYVGEYPDVFTYLPLEENGGLGAALRHGLTYCRNELVGRMDTDDISVPDRFEKQLEFMKSNPDVDVMGGNIAEFINTPDEIVDYKIVPRAHEDIVLYLKNRNPINHVTVMFKKSSVEKVGSYEPFYLFEDWFLWIKMYLAGAKFANVDDIFVNVRVFDMANRRGGMKYFRSFKKLLKYMKSNGVIGWGRFIKTSAVRFCGYVLLPNKLRAWAYKKFLISDRHVGEAVTEEKIEQVV